MQQKLPQGKRRGVCLRHGASSSPIELVALGMSSGLVIGWRRA